MNETIILAIWPYVMVFVIFLLGLQLKLAVWHYGQINAKISAVCGSTQEIREHMETLSRRMSERLAVIETRCNFEHNTRHGHQTEKPYRPIHWSEKSDVTPGV